MVLLRKTSLHEKTIIQLAVSNVFFLIMTGIAVIYTWQTPTLTQLALLIGTGVVAGCAQFALFEGMRQAPVGARTLRIYIARLGLHPRLSDLG
jgi:drug/metabolite transporter (DMT)-like permease